MDPIYYYYYYYYYHYYYYYYYCCCCCYAHDNKFRFLSSQSCALSRQQSNEVNDLLHDCQFRQLFVFLLSITPSLGGTGYGDFKKPIRSLILNNFNRTCKSFKFLYSSPKGTFRKLFFKSLQSFPLAEKSVRTLLNAVLCGAAGIFLTRAY